MSESYETDDDDVVASVEAALADLTVAEDPPKAPVVAKNDFSFEDAADKEDAWFTPDKGDVSLAKPWMKFHRFELVKHASRVKELVDRCLKVGRVALDLETEGFDNRIEYDAAGKPYTVHKIVGYCLGIAGEGYYIPVRHVHDATYGDSPNVDNVAEVEQEISRLCWASQPVVTEEGLKADPFGAKDSFWSRPPLVIIEFWHSKFDQEFLYPVTGLDLWHPDSFEDGMLMVYTLYTDDDQGLKENAKTKLDPIKDGEFLYRYEMIEFKELFHKAMKSKERKFYDLTPRTEGGGWNVVLYGCSDGICTDLLCQKVLPLVSDPKFRLIYRIEKQVVQAVRILERTRVLIDKAEILNLLEEAEKELAQYEEQIINFVALSGVKDFNPSSSSQLADYLFGVQGLNLHPKPEKTAEGQYKTDVKTLEAIYEANPSSEVLLWVIKHRQITKIKGTYLKSLANNTDTLNQLRLNFRQTGAATGRFTAPKGDADHGYGGIPIQGIPARDDPKKPKVAHSLRRVFIAHPGYVIVKVDYASQELRIAANVSGEKKWVNEYEKEMATGAEADLHFLTAQAFYPKLKKGDADYKMKRNAGKTANFALIYGGGVGAVQRATGCDKIEGARLKKAFDDSVPQFSQWVKKQHASVKEENGVRTAFGRFIVIPDANVSPESILDRMKAKATRDNKPFKVTRELKQEAWKQSKREQAASERKSTNFPIQGSGADILKLSLILLTKEFLLRKWLKSCGGDDSVRMIMTVHDEVVFEVREERVAEAVPIIVRIMEHPTYMTPRKWKVPLIAEAEIGSSWAAHLSWKGLRLGKVQRPPYLGDQELAVNPPLMLPLRMPADAPGLAQAPTSAPALESGAPSPTEVSTEVVGATGGPPSEPSVAVTPEEAPEEAPEETSEKTKEYAVFTLEFPATRALVQAMCAAVQESVEAEGGQGKLRPLQIRQKDGEVVYSAAENWLGYPEDLAQRWKAAGLGSGEYQVQHDG